MRHIRTRRRLKLILTLMLGVSLMLFVESRIESLVPQIKSLAESRIEKAFGNKFEISIGSVEGGLVTPLVLNGCAIKAKDGISFFDSVNILSIKSNYRIWDIFSGENKGNHILDFFSRGSSIDINFADKNSDTSGFIRFSGDLAASDIKGHIDIYGKERIGFIGSIRADRFDVELKTSRGNIKASGELSDDLTLTANLKTSHFKLYGFDINCEASLRNKFLSGGSLDSLSLEGGFETKSLVVNYKVFPDISAAYKIAEGKVSISRFSISNGINLRGEALLRQPHDVDIVLTMDNINITKALSDMGVSNSSNYLTGTLNGKLELKGPISKSSLDAKIEMRKGTIATLDYDYLTVHLKGDGPILRIEESRITRPSGYFSLAGEIDLRKIGKTAILEDIKITTSESAILWDDLDTSTWKGVKELSLTKRVSEEFSFGFKTFIADNVIDESLRDTNEMALEYKLQPNDSLKVMVGQDKNFFGLEHKDKF